MLDRGVGSNRKSWDTSREQTTLVERFCPELELSVPEVESAEGRSRRLDFRVAESPKSQTRENESCSRDRAPSNQPCPTGRFRLEVPQWIDFSSRGNFIFSKSYYNLNMNIGPPIFDFFMTQVRISKSMTPLKFTPTFPYIIDQKRICFSEKSWDFQKLQNVSNGIKSSTV